MTMNYSSCKMMMFMTIIAIIISSTMAFAFNNYKVMSMNTKLPFLSSTNKIPKTFFSVAISDVDLDLDTIFAKIFVRLSEKRILLDVPGAGTIEMMNCCHGGCDNCDFSRIFDEMKSGRAKWVPTYSYRKHIDGREHTTLWSTSLFQSDDEKISSEDFAERILEIPSKMTMGPPSGITNEELEKESAQLFFSYLQNQIDIDDALNKEEFSQALIKMTGNTHGALWGEWKQSS